MRVQVLVFAATLVAASAASADQMLVFRKASRFHGAAMRVLSYAEKDGQLLINGVDGNTFTAPLDSIDVERSKIMTAKLVRDEEAAAAKERGDATRRKAQAEAKAPPKALSLVKASRLYGVSNPGMSYGGATVGRTESAPPASDAPVAKALSEDEINGIKQQIEAAKTERERVAKDVDALEKDNNPDPLSAAQRQSHLADKRKELAAIDEKLSNLSQSLAAAQAGPATKATGQNP